MKTKLLLLAFGAFCMLLPLQSQVTVGAGLPPRKGSLLELKEDNNDGENSEKGFSLPRVKLQSPDKLTLDDDSKGEEYKGLTVQNTNPVNGLIEGIYCWDGKIWRLMVVVKEQGMDGQLLTATTAGVAPEWKSQLELNIPTVDLIANAAPTSPTYLPAGSGFINVKYDTIYTKDFDYDAAGAYFIAKKSAYYQVYIYNTLDVKGLGGTTSTNFAKRVLGSDGKYTYQGFLNFNAFYEDGSTYVCHPISGLVYFEKDQQYAVRTNHTNQFRITGGRIAFVYLRD